MCAVLSAPPDMEASPEPDYGPTDFARDAEASSDAVGDLYVYRELIIEWNARMNLVGPSALNDFWRRHALDSAQLFHVEQPDQVWLDVGAGAGFPGIVLAILQKHRGTGHVHLVESMAKRTRFLSLVAERLALPVTIHASRAETIQAPHGLSVITARACAPLPRLLGYTAHLFRAGTRGVFLKGRGVESELTDARRTWTFQSTLTQSRSDPSGRILTVERLARRGG
jgi:16S rRNA (guanine527-N7)-methyltransferase